jgi:hypothetical protein
MHFLCENRIFDAVTEPERNRISPEVFYRSHCDVRGQCSSDRGSWPVFAAPVYSSRVRRCYADEYAYR